MRHWLPLAFIALAAGPALAVPAVPVLVPALPTVVVPAANTALPAALEGSPTPPPVLTPASLTEHHVTRQEFAEMVASWVRAFETKHGVSLKDPKDTVLLYMDLTSGFREVAIELEAKYRMFENVDRFKYGTFEASLPITRLQTAQILNNLVGLVERSGVRRTSGKQPLILKDIPTDDAISESLNTLSSRGLMIGFTDGFFRGEEPLIRAHYESLVDVVQRYLGVTAAKAG